MTASVTKTRSLFQLSATIFAVHKTPPKLLFCYLNYYTIYCI
nr:MAG TPA: hypothetical protein [Caudoviricetes sp.]